MSNDGRLDELVDLIPSGLHREGNEVSLDAWCTLHYGQSDDMWTICQRRFDEWQNYRKAYLMWFEEETKDGKKNPHSRSQRFRHSQEGSADIIEHIAGVDCYREQGLNGNAISEEEMRLCSTSQHIVDKYNDIHQLPEWTPESDDEDFERESKYSLSGLAHRTAGMYGNRTAFPERHGLQGADMAPDDGGFENGDLIIHHYCLEIYKRVSTLRLDSTELTQVPDFADWWASSGEGTSNPAHESVSACSGEWFSHTPGSESSRPTRFRYRL